MRKFFSIFSYLLHPVLIPSIATGCYYFIMQAFYHPHEIWIALFQVAVMTFLLPMVIYLFLRSTGLLKSSLMVHNIRERLAPIFLNIVLIGILVFKILENNPNIALKKFLLAYSTSYILMFFFTMIRQKWSIHLMSFCALIPFLITTSLASYQPFLWQTAGLFIIAGLLASSRLALYAHTGRELFWGSFIGFLPQVVLFFLPLIAKYIAF